MHAFINIHYPCTLFSEVYLNSLSTMRNIHVPFSVEWIIEVCVCLAGRGGHTLTTTPPPTAQSQLNCGREKTNRSSPHNNNNFASGNLCQLLCFVLFYILQSLELFSYESDIIIVFRTINVIYYIFCSFYYEKKKISLHKLNYSFKSAYYIALE